MPELLTLYDTIGIPENMQTAIQGKFIKRKGIRMDVFFLYDKKIPQKIGEMQKMLWFLQPLKAKELPIK